MLRSVAEDEDGNGRQCNEADDDLSGASGDNSDEIIRHRRSTKRCQNGGLRDRSAHQLETA